MKPLKSLLFAAAAAAALFSFAGPSLGQGFVNLDFESATVGPPANPNLAQFVPFTNAFPGWVGYIGSSPTNTAVFNGTSVGAAVDALISTQTGTLGESNNVIDGNYTAVLCSGDSFGGTPIVSAALAQTGLVPAGTRSLLFDLGSASELDGLTVTFDGQSLQLVPLSAGPNYKVYGADISSFAGTTGELRFTESPTSFPFNFAYLDDIQFSGMSVPEPSDFALFSLGALSLSFWRRKVLIETN